MRSILAVAATALIAAPGAGAAPAGLPADAPPAATAAQPTLPEPTAAQWPFPSSFPATSGTGRLAGGAVLWSSFVDDDHGASLPGDLPASEVQNSSPLAPFHGDYVYPDADAENNGADIVRAAVGVSGGSTYWRVDWNTLENAAVPIAEWTFDTDANPATGTSEWPAGANIASPGIDEALLVSSRGAWLIDPVTGLWTDVLSHGGALSVDASAQSFIVRIPETLLPVSGNWTVRLAAGLANAAGDGFAVPTLAGGAPATAMAHVYDVAFRSDQQETPIVTDSSDELGALAGSLLGELPGELGDLGADGVSRVLTGNFWMDAAQASALASQNVSPFSLSVDWPELTAGVTTPEPEPTGYSVRWYVSRFTDLGGGVATLQSEGKSPDPNGVYNNIVTLRSRVQPYAVYVPTNYTPSRPARLTLLLHALDINYNEYGGLDPQLLQQLCQDRYSICVMPEGMGPELDWQGRGQTDLWQVWRAVADTYALNPNQTTVAGYSMGGSGTNIMASQHPDDFAGALVLDGPEDQWPYANDRWVPFTLDESVADELAPADNALAEASTFKTLGQRYELILHTGGDHVIWATEDRFSDAVTDLGEPTRAVNPGTFRYTWTPFDFDRADGLGPTCDYWICGLASRTGAIATVVADDHAIARPGITPHATSAALAMPAGTTPATEIGQIWSYGPTPPTRAATTLALTNVARLSVNLSRARMRSGRFTVTSDGRASLTLVGLRPGTVVSLDGRRVSGAVVRLNAGTQIVTLHPRNNSTHK